MVAFVSFLDFLCLRQNFIQNQLKPKGVIDTLLLNVLEHIPREHFLEKHQHAFAYMDQDIPFSSEDTSRVILSPVKLAKLFQFIQPQATKKILILGFNYGYSLVVAHALGLKVYGIEENPLFFSVAHTNLVQYFEEIYGTTQVDDILTIEQVPLVDGFEACALYDYILIEGGVQSVPFNLCQQLKKDGLLLYVSLKHPRGIVTHTKNGTVSFHGFESAKRLSGF